MSFIRYVTNNMTFIYLLYLLWRNSLGIAGVPIHLGLIGVFLILTIIRRQLENRPVFFERQHLSLITAVVIFIIYTVLSVIWSNQSDSTWNVVVAITTAMSVALLQFMCVRDKKDVESMIHGINLFFIILLIYGYSEIYTGVYKLDSGAWDGTTRYNELYHHYPTAGQFNTNNLAYLLCSLLPIALYDFLCGKCKKLAVLAIPELYFFFIVLINTSARLSLFAFLFTAVFLLIYFSRKFGSAVSLFTFISFVAIGAFLFFGSAFTDTENSTISFIYTEIVSLADSEEKSLIERPSLILACIKMFFAKPYGVGAGMSTVLSYRYSDVVKADMPTHNLFFTILADFGVVGFCAFSIIFFYCIKKIWNAYKIDKQKFFIPVAVMLSSVCLFFVMSFSPSSPISSPISYLILGLWLSYEAVTNTSAADGTIDSKTKDTFGYYDSERALKLRRELRLRKEREGSVRIPRNTPVAIIPAEDNSYSEEKTR